MRMSDTVDNEATKADGERTKSPSAGDEHINSKRDSVQVEDTFLIGPLQGVKFWFVTEEASRDALLQGEQSFRTYVSNQYSITTESADRPLLYSVCKTE